METGMIIGWAGVFFGLCVPIPQLMKIWKTKSLNDISMGTYIFLIFCLTCYLIHAIYIKSPVFTVAQSLNLCTNGVILGLLVKNKLSKGEQDVGATD